MLELVVNIDYNEIIEHFRCLENKIIVDYFQYNGEKGNYLSIYDKDINVNWVKHLISVPLFIYDYEEEYIYCCFLTDVDLDGYANFKISGKIKKENSSCYSTRFKVLSFGKLNDDNLNWLYL